MLWQLCEWWSWFDVALIAACCEMWMLLCEHTGRFGGGHGPNIPRLLTFYNISESTKSFLDPAGGAHIAPPWPHSLLGRGIPLFTPSPRRLRCLDSQRLRRLGPIWSRPTYSLDSPVCQQLWLQDCCDIPSVMTGAWNSVVTVHSITLLVKQLNYCNLLVLLSLSYSSENVL